ncbi:hypothetical protein [Clostridium taeniosporum]|uniref:hypothetical protein n=1 Tax=Clostridium taeniosporum TaxID=394958 RepID=UPI000B2F2BDE|nr:hypothetical protein [Clostridium taeniosporum]
MITSNSFNNVTLPSKNILRDNEEHFFKHNFTNTYSQNEFSNLILNSNLENNNIIK